jgi:S-DNA-T family DNA segregation ATPase FtsK/SpoIIIE
VFKNKQRKNNNYRRIVRERKPLLSEEIKGYIFGTLMILIAVLIGLSFFELSGPAGHYFVKGSMFLIGITTFLIPLIFILASLVFFIKKTDLEGVLKEEKKILAPIIFAILLSVIGITGIFGGFSPGLKRGGWLGYFLNLPLQKYFGFWATLIICLTPIAIGLIIFCKLLGPFKKKKADKEPASEEQKTSIIRKIFTPNFKSKEISQSVPDKNPHSTISAEAAAASLKLQTKPINGLNSSLYKPPSIDLLQKERGSPTSGDTRVNSAIIKNTLQNFGIDVVMSEVNIGPTVTQYTLKPAEGIKVSKITTLSNDLALALASHPIRIEAPIPGRSLVGVEVPNKIRAEVRMRDLVENALFQKTSFPLPLVMGRDVSGAPIYTDLSRMPHLLVAGSTGSGKTIFLNTLILSLLYQPYNYSPELLRLILVDPKRVEFPVYNDIPHLLCPVIYNAHQTVNALKWLTGEMERRFDVLAEARVRNISAFNNSAMKENREPLPFIVVVIDELADLMANRGREIEAGIVRLAQMARAVGIHLVVATQRPSVEVITGLIKANITSRVAFQVISQVDSRTILDTAGADKLLGSGDMLFTSAEISKPKRVQAPYISDKEVKRIVECISMQKEKIKTEMNEELIQELSKGTEDIVENSTAGFSDQDDSLYEEARKIVLEARKASSSLLQRRLRIGYARAARLIDILEEKGVVGPSDGAKPREILLVGDSKPQNIDIQEPEEREEDAGENSEWQKL